MIAPLSWRPIIDALRAGHLTEREAIARAAAFSIESLPAVSLRGWRRSRRARALWPKGGGGRRT